MNTTKKLLVLCLVALLGLMTMMPSTFSWYDHNGSANGNAFYYSKDKLPVSGSSGLSVSTVKTDENGEGNTSVSTVNFASASTNIQYYKTTFDNTSGTGDVFADLELKNVKRDANVKIGVKSPVINEKSFINSKTPKAGSYTRVYFQSTEKYNPYWTNRTYSSSSYDMLIRITNGEGTETTYKMIACPNGTPTSEYMDAASGYSNTWAYIYYYDIPVGSTKFYFVNHYYDPNDENKDWNRTPDITDFSPGNLYRLTGKNIDNSYKLYDVKPINNVDFVALNKYYSNVTLSLNGYIDIGLLKESPSDDDEFTPDYYGTNISYSTTSSNLTVNSDGLVTAGNTAADNQTVTTTITGELGDSYSITTNVNIKSIEPQASVVQNMPVKKGEKVEVYWYVINKSSTTGNIATEIFWTV